MRTEEVIKRIRRQERGGARERIDPEALWLDQSVPPEQLVRLDPLDITPEMVDEAEQPELGDSILQRLPARRFSLAREACERKTLQTHRMPPAAFVARLKAALS